MFFNAAVVVYCLAILVPLHQKTTIEIVNNADITDKTTELFQGVYSG